jgi:MFS family permease
VTQGADNAIAEAAFAISGGDGSTPGSGRFRLELPDQDTAWQDARPLMRTLGLPTLGLAFAISLITSYAGIVLHGLGLGAAKIGPLIGGEGAFALVVPLIAGTLSDRLPSDTTYGKRMPFVFAGAPLAGAGLVLLPFSPDYQIAGLAILMFYIGYYLYYPPYRAIYADLLPKRMMARAQSSQAIFRGVGLGVAMIAGGLFISIWQPLPFIVGAGVLGLTTLALKPVLRLQKEIPPTDASDEDEHTVSTRDLFLTNRKLQIFVAANALWEYSLAGLKIFIILYVTTGLGQSKLLASAMVAIVAATYVIGAPIAGRLADRFSILTVMVWSAAIYGTVLCLCVIPTTVKPMLILLPIGAIAGAILMTLPQALAFTLAPENSQGAAAGLVDFSRGIGLVLGPTLVGAAIGASAHFLSSTHGYAIMFPSIGLPVLLSIPLLRLLKAPGSAASMPIAATD